MKEQGVSHPQTLRSRTLPRGDIGASTLFIACAALGRDVRAIIKKHRWNAHTSVINAKVHLRPEQIGPAVEERLRRTQGQYERTVVVFGYCGATDLDDILERYHASRPPGPHCFEMYGGRRFAEAVAEEPGTFILTDFLVRSWSALVERGLLGGQIELIDTLFNGYRRVIFYTQEWRDPLVARATEIANQLGLPIEIEIVGFGELEPRLVAIMRASPKHRNVGSN